MKLMRMNWDNLYRMPIGARLQFTTSWDVFPITVVPAGTKATLVEIDRDNPKQPIVSVLPDDETLRAELAEWEGKVHLTDSEQEPTADAPVDLIPPGDTSFWERFDRTRKAAAETVVGKRMLAAGFTVQQTGGGYVWERHLDDRRHVLVCDEGGGLGDKLNETYLVGLFVDHHAVDDDEVPSLKAAIEWCVDQQEPA